MEWYLHPAAAASAGALLGLMSYPKAPPLAMALNAASGFLLGFFGGPWAVEEFKVAGPRAAAGICFATAAAGPVIFGGAMEAIRQFQWGPRIDAVLDAIPFLRRNRGNSDAQGGPPQ